MAIWGKIFGGVTGFLVGGPLGAIVGAAGGHWWDKQSDDHADDHAHQQLENQQRAIFSTAIVVLAAKMAKADGRVSRDEISVFKRIVKIEASDQAAVAKIYRQAQQTAEGFAVYAEQAAAVLGHGSPVLEELVWLLAEIAKADGILHDDEMRMLRQIAAIFGLSDQVFARIDALQSETTSRDPFAVLGIVKTATNDEIKTHYRNLVRQYHPDRLTAQGLPAEAIEASGRKLAAINLAYDNIKKQRNLR